MPGKSELAFTNDLLYWSKLSLRFNGSDPGSTIALGGSVETAWAATPRAELKILRMDTKYAQNF